MVRCSIHDMWFDMFAMSKSVLVTVIIHVIKQVNKTYQSFLCVGVIKNFV